MFKLKYHYLMIYLITYNKLQIITNSGILLRVCLDWGGDV